MARKRDRRGGTAHRANSANRARAPHTEETRPHREDVTDREMWDLYVRGMSQARIGDQYGITQQAVSERLRRYRASIPEEDLVQRRRAHLDGALAATAELWALAHREGAPVAVGKDGVPMRDPVSGEWVRDYSARVNALKELRAWQERESKLLGLDAATKLDVSATVVQTSAVDQEIAELSRLLGVNDGEDVPADVTEA